MLKKNNNNKKLKKTAHNAVNESPGVQILSELTAVNSVCMWTMKLVNSFLYIYPSYGCFSIKSTYSLALAPETEVHTTSHTNLAEVI